MKHMRAVVSDSVKLARLKISCTRPVKERQKFVSELYIGRRMASMSHETVIDSSQHTSTITCTAAPRVWHFSAFHLICANSGNLHS